VNLPRFVLVAGTTFFIFGLLGIPIGLRSQVHGAYYKVFLYFAAAVFFWVWLHRDAAVHQVSRSWQILVSLGWLIAAIPVVPIYLFATRGWRRGAVATFGMLAIVLLVFGLLAAGALMSTIIANALGFSASEA
jgi:hypothetical protein